MTDHSNLDPDKLIQQWGHEPKHSHATQPPIESPDATQPPIESPDATQPPIESPTLTKKAYHLSQASARILHAALSGSPITVSPSTRSDRLATCQACPLWHPTGNAGLGECRHRSCGCTRLKHSLATESCPLGKWSA